MTIFIKFCMGLMLLGALVSGVATFRNLLDLSRDFAAADIGMRRFMLYGPYLSLLDKVERHVSPEEGILLDADANIDPALLSYGLSPRPVWQPEVDPEMRVFFVDVPASPFPRRDPAAFPVKWLLRVTPANLSRGGELLLIRGAGGER